MSYRTRLLKDVDRWERSGWMTPLGAAGIRAEAARRNSWLTPASLLAMAGAVLLSFGVMLFVASNWQEMPKLARLGLLFCGMWAAYVAAAELFRRDLAVFAHAALLLAQGVFGASIMLIAQMYHLDGHPPDAVLMWLAAAGVAGVALRSNASLVLTVLLFALWGGWEISLALNVLHWELWPVAAALGAGIAWSTGWRPVLHLLVVAAGVLFLLQGLRDPWRSHLWEPMALAVAALAGGLLIREVKGASSEVSQSLAAYGLALAYAAAWPMHFDGKVPLLGLPLGVWSGAVIALTLLALMEAWRTSNRGLLWVAYAAFSAEIVSLYFKTLGTLLSTSVFFLCAGLLVIALSICAWLMINRRNYLVEAV
ncbi:MAG: DUF2157 domain-containing protein [Hyphomicrobiaceae bacterium]|nr:MAG: DUF2157 domain-containing protein [Hyphomicrobiaceae bacterium]